MNAYILAADPAWIEASILSYYDLVDRIVVSYDVDGLGWTGAPISVEQCLRRLRAVDKASKLDFQPGKYARPQFFHRPMESETYQRQQALDDASRGADWVLQLDTDEVVGDSQILHDCLAEANRLGRNAFNYPSIWLYSKAFGRFYLEAGRRGWRRMVGYPGPMAVRAGSKLDHARRGPCNHFHVDLTRRCSAGAVPNGIDVDRIVSSSAAIWHFAMVRTHECLKQKLSTSGHAHDRDWNPEIERWQLANRRPLWATICTQLERGRYNRPLRISQIPASVAALVNHYDDLFHESRKFGDRIPITAA